MNALNAHCVVARNPYAKEMIAATDVAAILGANPYCTARDLYRRKLGFEKKRSWKGMPKLFWGNGHERSIVEQWSKAADDEQPHCAILKGRRAESWQQLLESTRLPIFRCKPDAKQWGSHRQDVGILSCKTTSDRVDQPLEMWRIQLQCEYAITGFQWGSVGALMGLADFRPWDVERDERLIETIFKEVARFHELIRTRGKPEWHYSEEW